MTTKAIPLSAVKTILDLSSFNSLMAFLSSLVMLGGGLCDLLMIDLTSPLVLLPLLVVTCCTLVLSQLYILHWVGFLGPQHNLARGPVVSPGLE